MFPEYKTSERLIFRKPSIVDADAIFENYASNQKVTTFLGWHPHSSQKETLAFLEAVLDEWEKGTGAPYVVALQSDPKTVIGMIHPHIRQNEVMFGYVYGEAWWGQGYATEALLTLVDFALRQPSVFRASAFCDCEHHASARVMEKAGMRYEGKLKRYFVHPNLSPEPRDCLIYARTK